MRKKLGPDIGVRKKFRAVFARFGKKANYLGYADQTILLTNIRDAATNVIVTDHLWFTYTKGFEKVNLKPGVTVEFEARINSYQKGYVNRKYKIDNRREDYRLSHPTRIVLAADPTKPSGPPG